MNVTIVPSQMRISHLTLEKALDAVFWVDAEANICQVNEAACHYLGYSRDELTDLKVFDVDLNYAPKNWPEIISEIKNKGVVQFESSLCTKSGRKVPVEITSNHIEFSGQDYFFAIVRDISHHKVIERSLEEKNEHLLELFFSQSLDGFFFMMLDKAVGWNDTADQEKILDDVFDHQHITKVNDALLHQYNATREQFTGLRPKDLFQHDLRYGRKLWTDLFNHGRLHVETDERTLDGRQIWIEGDYICLYDDQGRITGHFGIQRDITNRKKAAMQQAQLKAQIEEYAARLEIEVKQRTADLVQSQSRLKAITDALPDLVFVYDEDGRYLEILAAESDLLCMDIDAMKGKRLHEIMPAPRADKFLKAIRSTIASGRGEVVEYRLKVPAGLRWFEARTGLMSTAINAKKCVVFVARDITDRKRAAELEDQNVYLKEEIRSQHNYGEIIGASKAIRAVFSQMEMVSDTAATVLLNGETGTGKELIARAIHHAGSRKDRTMIKVNCGAMPSGLVESELFGHEKGAFTGATAQKKGKFELAHKGTLFLDEVGELPLDTQAKLLRALQEQEFERVGGWETIKVDVRVIAATNRDLPAEVARGAFRSDLFFRLNIFPITVPPLRERCDDIPHLANFFIDRFSTRMGKRIKGIRKKALTKLVEYCWPGNVRELANILERAVILCRGSVILKEHIVGLMPQKTIMNEEILPLVEVERRHIIQALKTTNGLLGGPNGAAVILGMKRSTLWSRMQKLGITVSKEVV